MNDRITAADVARAAGVSASAVSLGLSGRTDARIPLATVARIQRAAAKLGYTPNRLASGLKRGRSGLIGVLVPDLSNAFFAGIIDGIESACAQHGLRVLLAHGRSDPVIERQQARLLLDQQVEGVLVMAADRAVVAAAVAVESGVPAVVIDERRPLVAVDRVVSDDRAGMAALVKHLVARGHRRIGLIGGDVNRSSAHDRRDGWRQGLRSAAVRVDAALLVGGDYAPESAVAAVDALMSLAKPPTAIAAASDYLAAEALGRLRARGVRVPADVALTGYADDRHLARALDLTTVDQDAPALGRAAVTALAERLAGLKVAPRTVLVPTRVVVRGSSARVADAR